MMLGLLVCVFFLFYKQIAEIEVDRVVHVCFLYLERCQMCTETNQIGYNDQKKKCIFNLTKQNLIVYQIKMLQNALKRCDVAFA